MPINRVTLSGNVVRDAEVFFTGTGDPVLNFSVAFDERRRDRRTGEWVDATGFVDCAVFGARGEALAGSLTKGRKVAIDGRLRWTGWESEGRRRSKLEVVVDEVEFMSPPPDGGDVDGEQLIRDLGGKPVEYLEEETPFRGGRA